MTISTYSELKTAIADWMARSDISASASDFITFGEAKLNRLIEPVSTTATLTGSIGSRVVSVASLSMTEPEALFGTNGGEEQFITPRALGTFVHDDAAGFPRIWAIEGTNITFERPLAESYSFRFIYQGKLALSDAAPTNSFLAECPDLYLAASIYWGCVYTQNMQAIGNWKAIMDEGILEIRNKLSQAKRGLLVVDPMLVAFGGSYNVSNDE